MSSFRDWLRRWLGATQIGTPTPDVPHADCLSLDFLFTETKEMLVRQLQRVEALDNKAGLLAGFDGVVIAAAVGLLPAVVASKPVRWPAFSLWVVAGVMALGIAAVLFSFIFAAKALRVQSFQDVMNPQAAYENWIYWDERESKMQLMANMRDSYRTNEATLNSKARSIKVASWSLLAGLILFCASAIGSIAVTV